MEDKGKATEEAVEKMSKMSAAFAAEEEIKGKEPVMMSGNPSIDRKLKNFIG